MALLLALALLTSLFVNWQLHSVGIAQTADYQCGEIEHQHTAECYEKVLVCGYEEGEPEDWNATKPDDSAFLDADYGVEQSDADIAAYSAEPEPEYIFVPHQHTDDCYQEVKTLTCYEEEHVHTDDCFDPEDGSLICDLFEHTHDDSCYSIEYELVCGLEEGELVEEPNPDYVPVDEEAFAVFDDAVALQPVVDDSSLDTPVHHHTDACYEEVLVCGLPEHHHTVNCLSDPLADVEDEETWSAKTNVVLTGAWADDLTAVAKSQLGYQQSERNFQLDDEDQTTVRHYTRYGAWYGNAYGAWDVMFLSYCLNYADVPQTTVPQRAGVQALRSNLRGSEWLKAAAEVELVPGDIVFYNSITTETVTVEEDVPQIMDDSADADIALLSLEPTAAEPQTEERTVSTETVGIVSDVDADTGTLTVISGDVDGKVAEVKRKNGDLSFEYCGDFYGCGIALGDLTDSTLADQLLEYMPQGARGTTKTVDADGNAAFEDLELGLYLIVQSKASNGYAPIKPFLVSLPMAENGKWNYEVDASPKVGGYTPVNPDTPPVPPTPVPDKPGTPEQPTEPTNPDTPKNPDGPDSPVSPGSPDSPVAPGNPDNPAAPGKPDNPALAGRPDGAVMNGLPQTGQLNWPVPVLAVSGMLLFAAGWVLNKKEVLP